MEGAAGDPFPLMELPPELRCLVYEEWEPSHIELGITHYLNHLDGASTHVEILNRDEWKTYYRLQRTCKLVFQELTGGARDLGSRVRILLDTKRYGALPEGSIADPENIRGYAPKSRLPHWLFDIPRLDISAAFLFRTFESSCEPAFNLATLRQSFERERPGRNAEEWVATEHEWKTEDQPVVTEGQSLALEKMKENLSGALMCLGMEELNLFLGSQHGNQLDALDLQGLQRGIAVLQQGMLHQGSHSLLSGVLASGLPFFRVSSAYVMGSTLSIREYRQMLQQGQFDIQEVDEEEQLWLDKCELAKEADEEELTDWLLGFPDA